MAATKEQIERAAALLAAGDLVVTPTETVYGLAANAADDLAVAKIFALKSRPRFNPLIIHVSGVAHAKSLAVWNNRASALAEAFWPGPLTMVLPKRVAAPIAALATAGLDTIALRAPSHPTARSLLDASGLAIAAPSANRSGTISPTAPQHVRASFGDAAPMILDGGSCRIGVESTIVALDGNRARLLRAGGVSRERIERVLGAPLASAGPGVAAPGMLKSHYAPRAALRLDALTARDDEAFLGFGENHGGGGPTTINLSADADLTVAASRLFSALHELDAICETHRLSAIAVATIPSCGLGEAINDRLTRAAAPRRPALGTTA